MTQSELMTVRVDGTEKVISFSHNDINDMTTARQIAGHVGEMMERSDGPDEHAWETLNVDFQRVKRVSSVALNQLIGIQSQARSRGIRLVLTNVPHSVREVFALTRLERMFEFAAATPCVSVSGSAE
jgi:anti-anti-sigma factor